MYDIVNDADILVASFETEADCERYMDTVALISERYSKTKRSNGYGLSDAKISEFVEKYHQIKDYAHIDLILYSLNVVITGKEVFTLTDRVIPFVRFFFASGRVQPSQSFFEILALFSRKDTIAIINYIRAIHNNNMTHRGKLNYLVCKPHDIEQALLVFYTASKMSDLSVFLKVDSYITDVFFMDCCGTQNSIFEKICSATQGFTLSSQLVSLATKICTWLNSKVETSISLHTDTFNKYLNRPEFRILNLGYKINSVSGDLEFPGSSLEDFYGIDKYGVYNAVRLGLSILVDRQTRVSRMLDRARLSVLRVSNEIGICIDGLKRMSEPSRLKALEFFMEDNVHALESDVEIEGYFSILERVNIQTLAFNLMCVIQVLSKSGEAAQKLSQRPSLTYHSAINFCYKEASKLYILTSKEIFNTYIQNLDAENQESEKTLLEYQWPLLQECVRQNPKNSSLLITDNFRLSNMFDFIENNLNAYGRLMAYGTFEDFESCGLLGIFSREAAAKEFADARSSFRKQTSDFRGLSEAFRAHLDELDVDSSSIGNRPTIRLLDVIFNLTIDILHTHHEFMVRRGMLASKSSYSEDGTVSVHILPPRHPLNLFVGTEKVSNCCMFPESAGYSCNKSAYFSSYKVSKENSHIIVGYDHVNESFIGSNWFYRIGSLRYRSSSDLDDVLCDARDDLPDVFQLDQFELSISHTSTEDASKKTAIEKFVQLTVSTVSDLCSTKTVILNASGYSEDFIKELLDETYTPAETLFKTNYTCFGYFNCDVYSDSEPNKEHSENPGMEGFYIHCPLVEDEYTSLKERLYNILDNPPENYECESCGDSVGDCGPLHYDRYCDSCIPECENCRRQCNIESFAEHDVIECEFCPTCPKCGDFLENDFCNRCTCVCDSCGDVVYTENIKTVGHGWRTKSLCEDCVSECVKCSSNFEYSEFSEEGLCESCADEENDEDEEDEKDEGGGID